MMTGCIRAPKAQSQQQHQQQQASSANSNDDLRRLSVPTGARQQQSIIQVYTDWTNHYLDKACAKRRVTDLQKDVTDGVLLADVIEAVTNQKVSDINRKPKSSSQMIDNIRVCLSALVALGVQLDGISAKDVRDGNLKAILGLFFSLSRHKQQQKQLKLQAQHEHDMPRLPSPYQKTNGSSIPMPASVANRRPTEKRAGPPPLHQPPGVPNAISSNGPQQQSGGAHSFIPTPHSGPRGDKLHHPNNLGRTTPPTGIVPGGTPSATATRISSKSNAAGHGDAKNNNNNNNNSMLDKLKLFNGKEKQTRNKPGGVGVVVGASNGGISKRTSSSSGFSSAKSEKSDSSTSLYCEITPKPENKSNNTNSNEDSKQQNPRQIRNRITKQPVTSTTNAKKKPTTASVATMANIEKERVDGEGRPEHMTIQENETLPSSVKQQNSNEQNTNNTGIPKPTATVKGVSKPANRTRQTVALVSPMPSEMSESSQSNSTGQSSESSSVIYRPSSDSDASPAKANPSPIKCISPTPTSTSIIKMPTTTKIETTFDATDKVITKESILHGTTTKTTNFILKEEEPVANVLPMQPLLRGYTRTRASLMHQGLRNDIDSKHHIRNLHDSLVHLKRGHADGSYSDDYSNIDIAAGYMSDCGGGHVFPIMENGGLKSVQEICDTGYLSEGGASPYAKRLHQLSQRAQLNGSVDISSKLHSSDDHGGPHSQKRLTRTTVSGTVNGSVTGGGGGKIGKVLNAHHETQPTPPPPGQPPPPPPAGHPHHVIYRSHHQRPSNKTDCIDHSNEIHPPPYRHLGHSSGGNGWPDQTSNTSTARMPELQRGKSDLELIRTKRHHHHHGSSTPSASPSTQQLHQQHSSNSQQQQNLNGAMSARSRLERSRKIGSGSKDDICNGSSEKGRGPPPAPAPNGHSQPPSPAPAGNLPLRNGESHNKTTNKVRGVPQSFGYVKRSGGSTTSAPIGSNGPTTKSEPRTAQVTAVPRTKVKVSGGTQTCTSDLHQHKSYSLTGPAAGQLSQGVRERLLLGSHSLPKPAALQRPYRPSDGSLSDTVYSDLQSYYTSSPYSNWLRYSAAYTSSLPSRASAGGLVEADSMESLSSLPAQLQHRASLTHARLLMHQRENSGSPVPRLSRSNSIRSTKSEKLYPSMLQRSDEQDPYYGIPIMPVVPTAASSALCQSHHSSQPTSPTPSQSTAASRYNSSTMSPIASSASSYGLSRTSMSLFSGLLGGKTSSKDDDVHGSSASLVSTASSLYSTPEEKQAHEIRKLKRELLDAQEKVHTLTSQLSTNAHVVSAFEQSLSNMTQRLQQLTSTAERKDTELLELRQTIELLRKQSVEAGLTSAHLQNMSPLLNRRTFDSSLTTQEQVNMARQLSADSVSSLNSLSSACSLGSSQHTPSTGSGKKKKKGWLRSSFSRAFSRSKKNKNGSVSDVEDSRGLHSDISAPSSPLLSGVPHHPHLNSATTNGNANGTNPTTNGLNGGLKTSQSSSAIYQKEAEAGPEVVEELRKQLREKDLVLTDIRLEALSSAHQLESLKDTVMKMRNEMLNLKQDNERLQRIVTSKSLTSSQSSLPRTESLERRLSMTEPPTSALFCADGISANSEDSRKLLVSVLLGSHGSYQKYLEEGEGPDGSPPETITSAVLISVKTSWDLMDCIVRRTFKDYISRVDSASSLGLSVESIWSYHVGEVVRYSDGPTPELLPHGYLEAGDKGNVRVCLKGALHGGCVDALAFETLIPKSILQRYICLLTEHRRIILCGPSGTGKSYLANKLAEFLVLRDGKESTAESIATFNVDHKSSKELRQYLANLAEQCESNAADLPSVIILDQLHHASSLGEVFNGFLNAKYNKCPYIIGTMNQATCSTTNLQLHHNFRWVLCANHMEPVKGFLGRYLRRRLIETEARTGIRHLEITRVIEWMSKVWHHLNKFLETHSSSDVTIGPRLFLSCPTDLTGSQVWFTDLWNYSVVPYLMEAVREGLQLYGRRAAWEDPAEFICQTYPWPLHSTSGGPESLLRLRPEDVGYNTYPHGSGNVGISCGGGGGGGGGGSVKSLGSAQSDTEGDPLLNMLMRLQEAANYSSPPSNDSDLSGSLSDAGSRVESTL